MIDWLAFFADAIAAVQDPLAVVLRATGCREGWLQGELFRAGREHGLRVNDYKLGNGKKADLSAPAMIAEIKIVGADYQPKMRHFIESDVQRMRQVSGVDTERYIILIIPRCESKTALGAYLDSCSFSSICEERDFLGFRLRIWRF
ncbi:MAG: hypothetical protein L0219_16770 [Phycisphaerales bacterium]|nr:hypothetical protein [Phycisphaerales bacterium]